MTADPDAPLLVALRALGLGDFLTAVPALRALADAYPHHRRVLAAPAILAPLAELTGAIDAVVDTAPLQPLDPSLHCADVAVNLHGRGPQSHRVLLASRPRRLIAFAHPRVRESAGGPVWRPHEHEVARWCRLLECSGIACDPGRLALPAPRRAIPACAQGATLLHPGAKDPARRWPLERWAAVAQAERRRHRTVVVTGGPQELQLASEVARQAGLPPACVVAGRTDVTDLAALVAAAGRVVCGDTGVAHLATALGTPSVVLFGPVSPHQWGPPPDRTHHRVLWAGRRGDPHGRAVDPGLLLIGVDAVLGALQTLPEVSGAPATLTDSSRAPARLPDSRRVAAMPPDVNRSG